jgi:hypothetical protein
MRFCVDAMKTLLAIGVAIVVILIVFGDGDGDMPHHV